MIDATDLMANNWVVHLERLFMRVVTIVPKMIDGQFWWVVNGVLEKDIDPIPITPELIEKIGWEKHQDNEFILGYRTKNNYYLAFIRKPEPFNTGDIIVGSEMKIIKYLHELQNTYRWDSGKHLEVNL